MRIALIAVFLVCSAGLAAAQAQTDTKNADKPEYSTGRTVTPETKGQLQPQGWTGPDHHHDQGRSCLNSTGRDSTGHAVGAGRFVEDGRRAGEEIA